MPYSITLRESLLVISFTGVVADSDLKAALAEERSLVENSPKIDELVDMSAMTQFSASCETVQSLGLHATLFASESRQALLAPSDLAYGMARMFQMYSELRRPNLRVFRESSEALSWLTGTEVEGTEEDDAQGRKRA